MANKERTRVMANKSAIVAGMQFGSEFLSNVCKEVVRLGGRLEMVFEAMKTDSESELAEIVAARIVSRANDTKQPVLKHLELVSDSISVSTDSFTKDSFFKKGLVKFQFGNNFEKWILDAIPEIVPGFDGELIQTQSTKSLNDFEIREELGNPVFSVPVFAAILKYGIEDQSKFELGVLLSKAYTAIFYVDLGICVVAVSVSYYSLGGFWVLYADNLSCDRRAQGCRFLSHSRSI